MSNKITKIQRWIDLVAFLAAHRYPASLKAISRNIPAYQGLYPEDGSAPNPAVKRMFERDKEDLMGEGIELTSEMRDGESFYSLSMGGFSRPFLRLVKEARPEGFEPKRGYGKEAFELEIEEQDAAAVLWGLRSLASQPGSPLQKAAQGALQKIQFDLHTPLDTEPESIEPLDTVIQLEDREALKSSEILATLREALEKRQTLKIHYRSMRSRGARWRWVDPWGLLHEAGTWYMIARDHDADQPRMFRVGRVKEAIIETKKAGSSDFAIPDTFRIRDWVDRKPWHYGPPEVPMVEVLVLLRFPRSQWAARNGLGVLAREHPDGSQERTFQVRDEDAFARWILGMAGDASILAPPDLTFRVERLARTVWERHKDSPAIEDSIE